MDYQVIYADDFKKIAPAVKQWIDDGWVPQGGICVFAHPVHKNREYFQAMIKEYVLPIKVD